jgi:hypothetical protein
MARRGSADQLGPSTKRAIQRLHDRPVARRDRPPRHHQRRRDAEHAPRDRGADHRLGCPVDAVVAAGRVTHNTGIASGAAAAASAGVAGAGLADALDAAERAAAAGVRRRHWRVGGDVCTRIRGARHGPGGAR